jgi:hypothetical protein
MRRLPLKISLALLLLIAFAATASAAVRIRVAVRPDTIPQCHRARMFTAVANTGDHPIIARIMIALVHGDSVVFGPFGGRVRLAPGERRHREFDFFVPRVEPGRYAWVAHAIASDSTRDRSIAPFLVVPGDCPPPPSLQSQSDELKNTVIEGMGLGPDDVTPTLRPSWGSIKQRYR